MEVKPTYHYILSGYTRRERERRKRGMMGKSAKHELGLPTGGAIMGWLLGLHMYRKENRVPLASAFLHYQPNYP